MFDHLDTLCGHPFGSFANVWHHLNNRHLHYYEDHFMYSNCWDALRRDILSYDERCVHEPLDQMEIVPMSDLDISYPIAKLRRNRPRGYVRRRDMFLYDITDVFGMIGRHNIDLYSFDSVEILGISRCHKCLKLQSALACRGKIHLSERSHLVLSLKTIFMSDWRHVTQSAVIRSGVQTVRMSIWFLETTYTNRARSPPGRFVVNLPSVYNFVGI